MYYNHGIRLHGLSKRTALDIKQESIIISLNFLKALLVLKCLILLIKRELNIQKPYRIFFSIITTKTPFLSSLLISLHYKSVKGVSYTKTNISIGRGCFIDMPTEVK